MRWCRWSAKGSWYVTSPNHSPLAETTGAGRQQPLPSCRQHESRGAAPASGPSGRRGKTSESLTQTGRCMSMPSPVTPPMLDTRSNSTTCRSSWLLATPVGGATDRQRRPLLSGKPVPPHRDVDVRGPSSYRRIRCHQDFGAGHEQPRARTRSTQLATLTTRYSDQGRSARAGTSWLSNFIVVLSVIVTTTLHTPTQPPVVRIHRTRPPAAGWLRSIPPTPATSEPSH
jgi:hypothetical protein